METLTLNRKQFGDMMAILGEMAGEAIGEAIFNAINEVDPTFASRIHNKNLMARIAAQPMPEPSHNMLTIQILGCLVDTDPDLTTDELAEFLGLKTNFDEAITARVAAEYNKQHLALRTTLRSLAPKS